MAASMAVLKGPEALPDALREHLQWYQRRFRLTRSWGLVWWHLQAWSALYDLTQRQEIALFVFELADWALSQQLETNGAFLVNYAQDGPGFHTACVMEGIAAAHRVALRYGDVARAEQYRMSWRDGYRFVDRLIIRAEDTYAMPKPDRSLGGVRESLTSSRVRIDYVAHTLMALVHGVALQEP